MHVTEKTPRLGAPVAAWLKSTSRRRLSICAPAAIEDFHTFWGYWGSMSRIVEAPTTLICVPTFPSWSRWDRAWDGGRYWEMSMPGCRATT